MPRKSKLNISDLERQRAEIEAQIQQAKADKFEEFEEAVAKAGLDMDAITTDMLVEALKAVAAKGGFRSAAAGASNVASAPPAGSKGKAASGA